MRNLIYLTDLDDTLFTSRGKLRGPAGAPVTTATNGKHSYMSAAHKAAFQMMRAGGEVIPVTARSSDAFGRVHLDFGTRRAVLANGAVLLGEDGRPDEAWLAHTSGIGRAAETVMAEMIGTISEEYGDSVRSWVVTEYDAPVYLCVKMNLEDPEQVQFSLAEIGGLLNERFDLSVFQQHVNGNNLSLTPEGISKRAACERLIETLEDRDETFLIGAGDSLTDLPFMGLCDYMMSPTGSQIANKLLPRSVREAEDA
jgi:hydroxymethylpyrimidine pyrophosphatase-like HAD family hydrolase